MINTNHCLFLFVALSLGTFCACNSSDAAAAIDAEGQELRTAACRYRCQMDELHQASKVLWDSVTLHLSNTLPSDMPADERKNMVAVRNTALIQMFEIYPTLDSSIQQAVENAGLRDVEIAQQMRTLKDSLDTNEAGIQAFMGKLEANSPEQAAAWRNKLVQVTCANCQ
ncbi:MAG TPA: hypothetical protein PKA00_21715 [Saprospiraceae bacterium]|nr:hypothetical protein [Saprospiraceae bacterium]HMQ85544.1 hypothetical protein [Saprospiraceae bacterium]